MGLSTLRKHIGWTSRSEVGKKMLVMGVILLVTIIGAGVKIALSLYPFSPAFKQTHHKFSSRGH